jgi:hypothetical protein
MIDPDEIEQPRLTNRERSRKPHGGKTAIYCFCDRNQLRVGDKCVVCGNKFYGKQAAVRDRGLFE